ncbi:MAG: HEAT repeat domain-containing protein [Acidobacteria bacterium]|nr:HEAT repeat domain-containing protein [Acidobacteriota bacterium]MBV9477864.1 HEAT repeat domain-containing protein [Acidobacteriota bacterium]
MTTADPQIIEQARSADPDARQKAAFLVAHSADERDLPLMFELLGDKDWRVRKTIVDGFVRDARPEIVDGLLDALADAENAGKRNSATEALIRIGDRAIPPIVERLRHEEDIDVRLSLVNLIGDLRSRDGFDVLVELLDREHDVNVASSIVSSLGKFRDAAALPHLTRVLAQRDDLWLKFHVIEALGEIGDRTALPLVLPLYAEKSLRKPVLEAVGKIADVGTVNFLLRIIAGEEKLNLTALRALVRVAEASKPRIVEQTERQLIQNRFRESFPREKIVPLLEHLQTTPKREVKLFILKFLGWSGDERAVPVLLGQLENPDTAEVAAQALIDFGPAAIPRILEALQNTDEDECIALLLRVVNMIGGRETIPSILQFLDHDNPMIRRLALETLGEIPDPASIDYLLAKLDDPDVASQQAAVNSISALVAAFPEAKQDVLAKIKRLLQSHSIPIKLNSLSVYVNIQGEGYHDELLLASKDSDPAIRQKAVSLMGKFGEERFADQLVLSLADEATPVRLAAINAIVRLRPETGLEPLISSLDDHDIWIRTAAAQALGEYRQPASIEPLMRHLTHDPAPVRIAVIEALGKSEDPNVKDVLCGCLGEADPEIQRAAMLALARIPGEDVFERLLKALAHDDWRMRAAAATALGMRGDRAALPVLHRALEDPDTYVQQSAVLALDKVADRSSFPVLFKALENTAILDDVSDVLVRHKDLYRDLLEEAWRTADSRREVVIAAILAAMKRSSD